MNYYDLTKAVCIAVIALCLPYCCEKTSKVKTYDAGIALDVQQDILRHSIKRRLSALEQITFKPSQVPTVQAVSASEAVHK